MEELVTNLLEFYRQSNSDIDKFELSLRRYLMSSNIFSGNAAQGEINSPPASYPNSDEMIRAFFDPEFLNQLESLDPDSVTDDDIENILNRYKENL